MPFTPLEFAGTPLATTTADDAGDAGTASATKYQGACAAELDACSCEVECRGCLKINSEATCKRDTLVDASHCGGVSEVVCCILEDDPGCRENAQLQAAIGKFRSFSVRK